MEQTKPNNSEVSYLAQLFFDTVDVVVNCFALLSIIGCFLLKTVVVSGESMLNTLHDGDKMVLTNFLYEPKNGDIVVIPHTHAIPVPIIKRVIAVGGQTLKIDFKENKVYVDGNLLDEPYISSVTTKSSGVIPEKIPEGYVFVMGDNRSNSTDSRSKEVGLVSVDNILGKAQFTLMPFNRFGSPYK